MSRFLARSFDRAGLGHVLEARRRGDPIHLPANIDLLLLGALADQIRTDECGDAVRIHSLRASNVLWVGFTGQCSREISELDLLREVSIARITGSRGMAIGIDWGVFGLEVAQVALGFGATDLTGPITKKSGIVISEDELRKVKGRGMVAATALKRQEITALVANAGRRCAFEVVHA